MSFSCVFYLPQPLGCYHVVSNGVSDQFSVARHPKSPPDLVLVIGRRPLTHVQDSADFLHYFAFGHQLQHLTFPAGEACIYADRFFVLPAKGVDGVARHDLGQVGFSPQYLMNRQPHL